MSYGKSVKSNSFYGAMETGGKREIEMPPLDQVTPIQNVPQPWDEQQKSAQLQDNAFGVPDELPQETREAMQQFEPEEVEQVEEVEESRPATKQTRESDAAANIRALREAKEKAERERDEFVKLLQMQMGQQPLKYATQQSEPEPEVDLPNIDDDSLVEGKYINKYNQKQTQELKKIRADQQRMQQEYAEAILEMKIKSKYPDFEQVVSKENVEILKIRKPLLAKILSESTDAYAKAVEAYEMIKDLGIDRTGVLDQDRARAIKNATKPRPLTSVSPQQGDSPLSKANAFANGELTSDMKAQLLREMNQIRKMN